MALQFGTTIRNAWADQLEATAGASARLQLFSGPPPASPADVDVGVLLVTMILPADWMSDAVDGLASMLGSWSGVGVAAGNAGHFRVKDAALSVCHMHGSVTAYGGGGDMGIDGVGIAVDQPVTVTAFDLNAPNV